MKNQITHSLTQLCMIGMPALLCIYSDWYMLVLPLTIPLVWFNERKHMDSLYAWKDQIKSRRNWPYQGDKQQ